MTRRERRKRVGDPETHRIKIKREYEITEEKRTRLIKRPDQRNRNVGNGSTGNGKKNPYQAAKVLSGNIFNRLDRAI